MITRSKTGIVKPNLKHGLVTNSYPENNPKKLSEALNKLVWVQAMHEELYALDQK